MIDSRARAEPTSEGFQVRIAMAGSTGLIGEGVLAALRRRGDEVTRLVRPQTGAEGILWDPAAGEIDAPADLEGFDAFINLAGRGIGKHRWTKREKRLLWESRVGSTTLLASALANLDRPPSTLINASALGYYGDRGEEVLTEDSGPGDDFLAELCVAWEAATAPAAGCGIRVVSTRSAMVLSPEGGALGRLLAPLGPKWLSPYRWGVAGKVGSGRQVWSWISHEDEVRAILHLLDSDLSGPVNLVAPGPVTNREFTKALGAVLRRPTVIPIPRFVVRIVLGSELADTLVLYSQRVRPQRLRGDGFEFVHTDIEGALAAALRG